MLKVYVNNELMMQTTTHEWSRQSLSLDAGDNTVRFDYSKDGSASNLEDAVWIDNIVFSQ